MILPAVAPVLLISIVYVDPGKWAAITESGAHFGFELVAWMLVFNFAAIFCQYLSARIGLVTGRDLAQICRDEYDKFTCLFLGVQIELSVIVLDLTMILGLAHGLNLLFGWDLFSCVFLTAINTILFPLFAILLENSKTKFLCICISGFILLSVVLGVLISQTEISLSMNWMLTKLCGENAFALMSLLGANIMPHNFFLHSSIVQQSRGSPNISKDAMCHNHFVAILCVFSGIYLVNYVLMISAANVFSGLVLLTFQDSMSLMEQVFRSPIAPFAYLLVLFFSNQITSLNWGQCGRVVLHDFLKVDIPGWLHCATIRVISVVPALYCVWSSGAEGMYQLLIVTQVMVALLLPSSVIPLFRVAASRPIMGVYKISQFVEFLALITFSGMLVLKIIFMVEMIFGNSDWVANLRWNMGGGLCFPYPVLVLTACASLGLMLWLLATPLKSASAGLDAQMYRGTPEAVPGTSTQREDTDLTGTGYQGEAPVQKQEPLSARGKDLKSHSDMPVGFDVDLPEHIMEPDQEIDLTTVEENFPKARLSCSPICGLDGSAAVVESFPSVPLSTVSNEVSDVEFLDDRTVQAKSMKPLEKTMGIEGEPQTEKDDDRDTWEPEESSKGLSASPQSLISEGPGSFRSLSGKGDEGGSGTGSLSRLAGLGRAARRQLAAVLDEFWGQLYDFHGQTTQEAKLKKLDVVLGVDSKSASSSLNLDATAKEFSGCVLSAGVKGSDNLITSSLYEAPKQQNVQRKSDSSYGVQRGSSSLWSNPMHLMDAYVQNPSHNVLDSGERRYSSLRNLPSTESRDYQPATIHGYQIAAYRMAKERNSDHFNNPVQSAAVRTPSLGVTGYRDSIAFTLGQKLQNEFSSGQPSGYQNPAISRESPFHSEKPADIMASSANTKKYCSLPDMSGFSVPQRDLYVTDKSVQWDHPIGYGSSVNRTGYELSLHPNPNLGSRTGAPLAFDELSPSKIYSDGFSSQSSPTRDTGSLWSRQPFERFGVADKNLTVGSGGVGSRPSSITQEAISVVDSEAKLLQAFRHCIVKLLKLEGSDWLFSQSDGADEDLIDRVAARERFLYEAETREMNRVVHRGDPQYLSPERKFGSATRNNEVSFNNFLISSVPHCGEGCIWRPDLIVSFGVWCIHRILDLSLMESRPELWGKYTYVLNRLQGIIDVAFVKPHSPMSPCFCLQIPAAFLQKSTPPVSNGMLPPASKPGRGKCTNAGMLLDMVKDVEIAISCRKGRTGTAAGDVAFPKGKENLASVLKRYKRRLSSKPVGVHEASGQRKVLSSAPYNS